MFTTILACCNIYSNPTVKEGSVRKDKWKKNEMDDKEQNDLNVTDIK